MSETNTGSDKSIVIALILSFFVWGLGQLYQGRTKVGLIWIVVWLISAALSFFTLIFAVVSFALWLINLYDTYAVLIELD